MKDTIAGYAGWFIENRVAPAAPYFVAFVLCLGLLGGVMSDIPEDRGGFEIYDIEYYPDAGDWYMFIPDQHTLQMKPGTIPIKAFEV